MNKSIARIISIGILIILAISLVLVLRPRKYDVPLMKAYPGIRYWDLSTGSRIAYKKLAAKGVAKQIPIVYLHGGPGGFMTLRLEQALSPLTLSGYDVYLYDQIGSGHSARLSQISQYTAERHTKDLEAILLKIGFPKVIIYGHSWGAILATLFVADHPDKVDRLILSGPGHLIPVNPELVMIPAPDSLNLKQPQSTNHQANKKVSNLRTKAVASYALWFGKKMATDKEMDDFQTYLNRELNKSTVRDTNTLPAVEGGGGYFAQLMTLSSFARTPDPRKKLGKAKMPVLIMRGQYDNQPWGYVTEYLQLLPQSKLVMIPESGHSLLFDQPEMVTQTLESFLLNKNQE